MSIGDDSRSADRSADGSPDGTGDGIAIAKRLVTTVAVLAVVGTVVALVLVNRIGEHYRDALQVASDGAEVAAMSAQAGASIATDLVALTEAAGDSLDQAEVIITVTSDALASTGTAMDTNLAEGFVGASSVADGLASVIEAIERFIPGDSQSLAEDLRALSDGLAPVPDQLHQLGTTLLTAAEQLESATTNIDQLQAQLDALEVSIEQARVALDSVDQSAQQLALRADNALDDSGSDLWLVRLLVVVMGAGIALACLAARRALGTLAAQATRSRRP